MHHTQANPCLENKFSNASQALKIIKIIHRSRSQVFPCVPTPRLTLGSLNISTSVLSGTGTIFMWVISYHPEYILEYLQSGSNILQIQMKLQSRTNTGTSAWRLLTCECRTLANNWLRGRGKGLQMVTEPRHL